MQTEEAVSKIHYVRVEIKYAAMGFARMMYALHPEGAIRDKYAIAAKGDVSAKMAAHIVEEQQENAAIPAKYAALEVVLCHQADLASFIRTTCFDKKSKRGVNKLEKNPRKGGKNLLMTVTMR